MAVTLKQLFSTTADALIPVKFLGWIKSAGTQVVVNEDNPLPVTSTPPSGTSATEVQGNVASGATDAGNPVKVGGRYNSTFPTFVNGQRSDLQQDLRGNLRVTIVEPNGTSSVTITGSSDTRAGGNGFVVLTEANLYNATTSQWERQRNNQQVALLASASRTTTQTSADIINYNGRGLIVVLSVTTVGAGSLTVSIDGKDANGIYFPILTGTAVILDSVVTYQISPGMVGVANSVANAQLPRTFRIVVTANNANAVTYSVGYGINV